VKSLRVFTAAAICAGLLVSSLAGTAWAPWRGLSDLFYDDGGRTCRDGAEFSLSHFSPVRMSVEVTNLTADPDVVVATKDLARLLFAPVPEQFINGDYVFSHAYRVRFTQILPVGTEVQLRFSGGANGSTTELVDDCRLGEKPSQFIDLKDPPGVNAVTSLPVRLIFRLPGNAGLDIFDVGPTFAPIPCSASVSGPFTDQSAPTAGELRYNNDRDRYVYRWSPPAGLTGCQEVSFRLRKDGLFRPVMFDFGP